MAALLGDKVSPELEAEIAEEEKAIEHLVRSNAELEAHLKDAPDRELRAAVGENIVVIARKRAALQLKYRRPPRRRRRRARRRTAASTCKKSTRGLRPYYPWTPRLTCPRRRRRRRP